MRHAVFHRLSILLVALASASALAAVASADEGEASAKVRPAGSAKTTRGDYVSQLTPAELAFLQKRLPGWEKLDPAKKQRIARNVVVRLRSMTDAEKKRLREHIKRLPKKGGSSQGRGGRRKGFRDHATHALINRALARDARKKLGRDFERRLRRGDISDHGFERSFAGVFWRKVTEQRAAAGAPPEPGALPADFSKRGREYYTKAYTKWAALPADHKDRASGARRLHAKLVMHQGDRFRAKLAKTDLKGDAYVAAVGAAVREQWPRAFAETVRDPDALVRSADKYELRRSIWRIARRSGRLERDEAGLLVGLLNRLSLHQRKGDAASQAIPDAALKQVLKREFRVSDEALKDLPPAGEPEAREAYFRKLLATRRVMGLGRSHWHGSTDGRGRGKGRSGGPRGMPKLERPEGLSDADWTAWLEYRQALQAAMAAKDAVALKRLRGAKPAAMSDEGYALVRKALKAKFGQRSERGRNGKRER